MTERPTVSVLSAGTIAKGFAFEAIVGESPALLHAIDYASRAARTPSPVLLTGEPGTGKELFARGIHLASAGADQPFVAINCSAVPERMLELELLGLDVGGDRESGPPRPGLLERAGSGTVFLDEVHDLPLALQAVLLRALEERRVRRVSGVEEREIACRLIAATSRDLGTAVSRREFREELLEHLSIAAVNIPPLRDRGDDLLRIADSFLTAFARHSDGLPKTIDASAAETLRSHKWPGNVRELKAVIERAALAADGPYIRSEHVLVQQRRVVQADRDRSAAVAVIQIPAEGKSLADIEREAVALTMRLTRGNVSAAARLLGISRPTLRRKFSESLRAAPRVEQV